jgi:hypothetical protein
MGVPRRRSGIFGEWKNFFTLSGILTVSLCDVLKYRPRNLGELSKQNNK